MQFLLIGRIPQDIAIKQLLPLVKPEATKVWELYASDRLRSIHYITDKSGVVLLYEADCLEEVNKVVASLPMVQAGVLKFEIIPLMPFTGIEELFA